MAKKKYKLNIKQTAAIGISGIVIAAILGIFGLGIGFPVAEQQTSNPLRHDQAGTIPLANVDVDDILEQIPEEILIDIPPVTSEDPIDEQINENIENILGPDEIIAIGIQVQRIDGLGNIVIEQSATPLSALSLFTGEDSPLLQEFSNGRLEINLQGIVDNPDVFITGIADFDILINNQSVFTSPITVAASGTPEITNKETGESQIQINFLSDIGIESRVLTFLFRDHLDLFNSETNTLEIVLSNIDFKLDGDPFGIAERTVLYTMGLELDNEIIIVQDTTINQPIKALATDNDLTIIFRPSTLSTGIDLEIQNIILTDSSGIIVEGDPTLFANAVSNGTTTTIEGYPLQRLTNYDVKATGITVENAAFTEANRPSLGLSFVMDLRINTPASQQNYDIICFWGGGGVIVCNLPECEFVSISAGQKCTAEINPSVVDAFG